MASHEAGEGQFEPPIEPSDGEPPIMWPSSGSGFEADPFSPAGTAEREWALAQSLGRSRMGTFVVWSMLAVIVLVPVVTLLITVIARR